MVVAYSLECGLCTEKSFRTRSAWLNHLLEESHQLAEVEGLPVTEGKKCSKMQERALVVYARFPVASVELLEGFCSVQGTWLVTNFVAVPGRPRVGVVFFESRKVSDRVYDAMGGPQVWVCDKVVEIKKGADFLQLEWEELLLSVKSIERASSSLDGKLVSTQAKDSKKQREDTIVGGLSESEESSRPAGTVFLGTLIWQFRTRIFRRLLISDPDTHPVNQCMLFLKQAFQRKFASSELYPFQEWGYDFHVMQPCFYFDYSHIDADAEAFFSLLKSVRNEVGGYENQSACFLNAFKISSEEFKLSLSKLHTPSDFGSGSYDFTIEFLLKCQPQLKGPLITYKIYVKSREDNLVEAETDRLFQYLLTFDPRARPLHATARFGISRNSLNLNMAQLFSSGCQEEADNGGPPKIFRRQNVNAFTFLVIFFLGFKKLIPTVREVLQASTKVRLAHGVNIGFISDDDFRQNWLKCKQLSIGEEGTEGFVLSVLELASEFFEFCSVVLRTPDFILNLRDAEILTLNAGLSGQCEKKRRLCQSLRSNLTWEEAIKVKTALCGNLDRSGGNGSEAACGKSKGSGLVFLHPLLVHACFQLSSKNVTAYEYEVMDRCAKNLVALIDGCKMGSRQSRLSLDLESALKLGNEVREQMVTAVKSRMNRKVDEDGRRESEALMTSGVSSDAMSFEFVKVTSFK